ncbi:hypothetical protein QVD17_19713 [Tagetes erecta]|uniref:Uncharacterized protein n=1 Tax=Tagetes erecta TaxID=13708 RepID=A0AAD8NXG1_TARER|nr:hypothetical protein QVD17_19713 [Tagetes erecta]
MALSPRSAGLHSFFYQLRKCTFRLKCPCTPIYFQSLCFARSKKDQDLILPYVEFSPFSQNEFVVYFLGGNIWFPSSASLNLVSISKRIGGSKRMVKGIDDSCLVSDLRLVFEPALYRGEQAQTYSKTRTPIACIDTRPDKLKLAHCTLA